MTKLSRARAAAIARNCELSASNGQTKSPATSSRSQVFRSELGPFPSRPDFSLSPSDTPSMSLRASVLARSSSARSAKSFHIRYLVKDKLVSETSSAISHPGISRSLARNVSSIVETSNPASFMGGRSPSSVGKWISNSCLSISISVGLTRTSPSCARREKPDLTLGRSRVTGIRMIGAR